MDIWIILIAALKLIGTGAIITVGLSFREVLPDPFLLIACGFATLILWIFPRG